MSKKINAQRKRAFLAYLAQSGNQTISAERARVSRAWVCAQRQTDSAFDAACRAALEQARGRLGAAGSGRPAGGRWQYHGGHALVVGGSNKRPAQLRRANPSQWTARVEERFLGVLAATCNVRLACREAGLWPPAAYAHARRWPAFARLWEEAVAIGRLAVEGRTHENVAHFLDPEMPAPDAPMPDISVRDAIRLMRMYERRERDREIRKKKG